MRSKLISTQPYLCHVENKVGNCGQCSASDVNICIYFKPLKTNLDLWEFQINSAIDIKENHNLE